MNLGYYNPNFNIKMYIIDNIILMRKDKYILKNLIKNLNVSISDVFLPNNWFYKLVWHINLL